MGFSGSETAGGAYSLGVEQIKLFLRHIQRRKETLERIVNLHLVRPIAAWNHGMTESFPRFVLKPPPKKMTSIDSHSGSLRQ